MKLTPSARCFILIWPGPGSPTSTCSYVRTSGPPTLCTRIAATIVVSLMDLGAKARRQRAAEKPRRDHRRRSSRRKAARDSVCANEALTPAADDEVRAGDIGGFVGKQEQDR